MCKERLIFLHVSSKGGIMMNKIKIIGRFFIPVLLLTVSLFNVQSQIPMPADLEQKIRGHIGIHYDFPKEGIVFQDFFPIFRNPDLLHKIVDYLVQRYKGKVDVIVGLDSRGFLLGPILAYKLKIPFVPVRKVGKLPGEVYEESYSKEYGEDRVVLATDSISKDQKVVIIDDLIATGGSAKAAVNLVKKASGIVYEVTTFLDVACLRDNINIGADLFVLFPELSDNE